VQKAAVPANSNRWIFPLQAKTRNFNRGLLSGCNSGYSAGCHSDMLLCNPLKASRRLNLSKSFSNAAYVQGWRAASTPSASRAAVLSAAAAAAAATSARSMRCFSIHLWSADSKVQNKFRQCAGGLGLHTLEGPCNHPVRVAVAKNLVLIKGARSFHRSAALLKSAPSKAPVVAYKVRCCKMRLPPYTCRVGNVTCKPL
jgi:hypothetical protein